MRSVKIQKAVKDETLYVTLGVLIGDGLMLLVFFLLDKLDYTVWLGTALGSVFAVLGFFLLGLSVQKVTDSQMTPEAAARYMKSCYTLRMMLMLLVIILGVVVKYFHFVAVIVPFFMPQAAALLRKHRLKGRKTPEEKKTEESVSQEERGEN